MIATLSLFLAGGITSADALSHPPTKQELSGYVTIGGVHEVGNNFLRIEVEDSTCEYSFLTGPSHPRPGDRILFPLGTSHDTFQIDAVNYVTPFFDPSGGAEVVVTLADNHPPAFSETPNSYTCIWNISTTTITQTGEVTGNSLATSAITISTLVANNGQDPISYQQRHFWDVGFGDIDFNSDGNFDDGPDSTPQDPLGVTSTLERNFQPPVFGFLEMADNEVASSGLVVGMGWSDSLFRLIYGEWSPMDNTAFDYTTDPLADADSDSAVALYFGGASPIIIPAGGQLVFVGGSCGTTLCDPVITSTIGGHSIGIDTTSLLVAGVHANAFWLLPFVMGAAGITLLAVRKN